MFVFSTHDCAFVRVRNVLLSLACALSHTSNVACIRLQHDVLDSWAQKLPGAIKQLLQPFDFFIAFVVEA